jgi:Flp pilus assembly protein protease CpaA
MFALYIPLCRPLFFSIILDLKTVWIKNRLSLVLTLAIISIAQGVKWQCYK